MWHSKEVSKISVFIQNGGLRSPDLQLDQSLVSDAMSEVFYTRGIFTLALQLYLTAPDRRDTLKRSMAR